MNTDRRSLISRLGGRISRRSVETAIPPNPCHDDIYLVEYPKSGITYLSFLLGNIELILAERQDRMTFFNHHRYVMDVHQLRGANILRQTQRTFIKSHSEYNWHYYFVIYLLRNPLDVMVSYYNFMRDHGYKAEFGAFVRDRRFGIEKWKTHLNGWWYKRVDAQRMHFLRYEDLLEDPAGQIRALYRNFGVEVPADVLETSIRLAGIEDMRASEEHYRNFNPNYTMAFVGAKDKLRKGDILTPDIREHILAVAGEQIESFYPEIINKNKR